MDTIARVIIATSLCLIVRGDIVEFRSTNTNVTNSKADDDHAELPSGLVATFSQALSASSRYSVLRIDSDVQFNWGNASPDPRVQAEGFQVRWQGKLLVQASGRYRFHLFAAGTCRLAIDGKQLISGATNEPGWLSSDEFPLEVGHYAIELSFNKTAKQARIGLFWESNRFGLEAIGPRWLSHVMSDDREPGDFERGGELVRAFRCAACHTVPGVEMERKAPALDHLADRIDVDWLVRWLENPQALHPDAHMPSTGLSNDDARAIASYLISASKKASPSAKAPSTKGRPDAGESLVWSLGCLACHTLGSNGVASAQFGGGALDRIAEKRPAAFFREWLKKPESLNAAHRMPVFTLTNDEIEDLTSFLSSCGQPQIDPQLTAPLSSRKEEISRGKQLVVDHRCAACHDIPGIDAPAHEGDPLHGKRSPQGKIDWQKSCLNPTSIRKHRPRFTFDENDRRAIVTFIAQLPAQAIPQSQFELGRRLLRELNCTNCHPRDLDHGLQPAIVGRVGGDDAKTEPAKLRGELEPPSLTSAGDKFNDAPLAKLIVGGLAPRRPWLKVRMPRFSHTDAERDAIVEFLVGHDRIPTGISGQWAVGSGQKSQIPNPKSQTLESAAALPAGHQLVSSRGFGCMSCHTVGKHVPKNVEANARGSDLLKIGDRVRHEWFLRWTRDPARIVPGMEMPSISVPVRGLLDDRLDHQIESLWQALNSPSFVVPSDRDTAQQIISLKPGDAPVILRDVMYDCPPGSGWCPRSFAIGLPNRHNLLVDLDSAKIRSWWIGDFARQRTDGKSWLWEAGGLPVWDHNGGVSLLEFRDSKTGEVCVPVRKGDAIIDLDEWTSFVEFGRPISVVSFRYDLKFQGNENALISETFTEGTEGQSFVREVSSNTIPAGFEPFVFAFGDVVDPERKEVSCRGPLGETVVRIMSPHTARWDQSQRLRTTTGRVFEVRVPEIEDGDFGLCFRLQLAYSGPVAQVSSHVAAKSTPATGDRRMDEINTVPGFQGIRLPLNPAVMPTAISFGPGSKPIVCSLKGQVFIATDEDADGMEDTWRLANGDHFAAPFGILLDRKLVIVAHKPELVSFELPGDDEVGAGGRVLATGWGYTEDYHDWTFGPVRDSKFQLYIATANDYAHKGRSKTSQKWRGRILKTRRPTEIEEVARGLRYPTGIAITRDDQIFVTDNQGVQNTFNEINHIVPGSRYGVPSQDDPLPEKDSWPLREPAIKIPHPWTRSVNGICFLDGPSGENRDAVRDKWGPFAGHGIGCEYDTRGLIRFTLQKIGDTYQGACYPFTLPEDQVPQDQRLLGPICCAVSPNGDLYVGGLRDSGWGGGNNVGELVRIKPSQNVPLGIREVRAWREGFVIDFTGPIDAAAVADASKYTISSYHRIWKGTYATPDSDRRTEKITKIEVAEDGRSLVLTLDGMRPGFVYEIHIKGVGPHGQSLWPAEAYYTLNQIPQEDPRN